ncbi:MAG: SDR family oxidoreductase [Alicyclobacillaceae bacterium]|jgi:NAD(P)-dependent dehydrogenase (short-subunit alcohol dehydrogenase family)|uniref:SDR family NAD(P)-dependent oxidoreductase n=1 Tax=Alicyclobacillus sp. SP_1 TaxID=2942475 RepID=UPI0021578F36|nr:SDR family oxidoreductase [Alicyclobacillus sp. SP_1]MCY0887017.1 SDR family oxidoreductase [Alicyclobacillaceae bacterium]MCY0897146.1 SDR family oxidoreductase [Alicyclobacillaceae bacterium]
MNSQEASQRDGRLYQKVALITGAAGGIGAATARQFAREGAQVVLADLRLEAATELAEEIVSLGGAATAVRVDVSDYDSVQAAVQFAEQTYGHLDILFNNAGIFGDGQRDVTDLSLDEYHRTVRINQDGVFYGIKAAGAAMKEQGGVIINTASIYAFIADRRQFSYHATKAAVVGMTRAAALDLAKYNIRVVAIAPSMIDTPLIDPWRSDERVWNTVRKAQMRQQFGRPEQVAAVVTFLASDEASFVNGHEFFVDDGAASFKR